MEPALWGTFYPMSQELHYATDSAGETPGVATLRCEGSRTPLGVDARAPRLSWQLQNIAVQRAYQICAASSADLLNDDRADLWDSGRVESTRSVGIPYAGVALNSRQRVYWQVRVWDNATGVEACSEVSWWEMGLLEPGAWQGQWIGRPEALLGSFDGPVLPSPLFRKSFDTNGEIVAARASICGLGYFEMTLNGTRVGDHVLDPIVTQYDDHVGYVTHDVTDLLTNGRNALGVMLGNGWYNTHTREVWHFDKASWRDYPKLLLQLDISYADGRKESIVSDSSWRVTDGPIRFDGLRNGETYDAREEKIGWDSAGYDDAEWQRAMVVAGPGGALFSQQAPPCRVVRNMEAKSWNEVKPGVWVFDFGQNMTGWTHLTVSGPAGTEVVLRYAERVLENGEVDQKHISCFIKEGDFQTDRYVLKGGGEETYHTHFTYHGFQWVEVQGLPAPPTAGTLQARVIQSDFAPAGRFECSDGTLNQLQKLTQWSYVSNFTGIPTDCPHREKNGWTGDAQLACETGLLNYDAANAYAHWLGTIADAQRSSGQLPGIVPTGGWGYNWGNGPAWDSAFIVIPWQMYRYRGDKGILAKHYDGMKRYVHFAYSLADEGLIKYGLGDWCPPEADKTAPRDLCTTAILFEDCRILAKTARLLGHEFDAKRFDSMAAMLRASWRKAYVGEGGAVAGNEQTSLGCALYYDLLEDSEKPQAAWRLRQSLEAAGGRPTFGILGAKWVPRALSEAGHAEEAFHLITGEGYPGWAHWLSQGATTLWEEWNGVSSHNHIMFGDISAWMYSYLGGIQPLEETPGFARFLVAPAFVEALEHATAEHDSPYGRIRSAWKRDGDFVEWEITVPGNSEAVVRVPPGYGRENVPGTLREGRHVARVRKQEA